MATPRVTGEASQSGVERAFATMLTVLQLLDEQWDTIDDHSRRATVRLTIETARDQWRRIQAGRPLLD